jgi:hypothetical protein
MHEYTECYLYYSCFEDESVDYIKDLWYQLYLEECGHLKKSADLLKKYEDKKWETLFPGGAEFPELLKFGENKEYVRKVLKETGCYTADKEWYEKIQNVPDKDEFFAYNRKVNKPDSSVASHQVIEKHIKQFGKDYRYEESSNPIPSLRDRKSDNIEFGRFK